MQIFPVSFAALLATLCILLPDTARADFVVSKGTEGRFIRVLVAGGSAVYAGTDKGVYRSTDTGATWSLAGTGGVNLQVMSMAASGTTVVAGFLDSGVAVSSDGGNTWKVSRLGLVGPDVYSVGIRGTELLAGTIDGLFSSNDGGKNWDVVWMGGAFPDLVVSGSEALTLEVAGALYSSAVPGALLVKKMENITNGKFFSTNFFTMALQGERLFAGSDHGVWRSNDRGATWANVGTGTGGIPASAFVVALAPIENFLLAGTNSYGVYLSGTLGDNWVYAGQGLPLGYTRGLLVLGGKVLVGTGTNGVYRRTLADMPASIVGKPRVRGISTVNSPLLALKKLGLSANGRTANRHGLRRQPKLP